MTANGEMEKESLPRGGIVLSVGGCAPFCKTPVNEQWATVGNKTAAVVVLSYKYQNITHSGFGCQAEPKGDEQQGLALASSTCAEWGYSGARPFGPEVRPYIPGGLLYDEEVTVTRAYQCLGQIK